MLRKILLSAGCAALIAAAPGIAAAKGGDHPEMKKLGGALNVVYNKNREAAAARSASDAAPALRARPDWSGEGASLGRQRVKGEKDIMLANVTSDGYVALDAIASGVPADLAETMEALGAREVTTLGQIVSAQVPVDRLGDLAASGYLAYARPVLATTNVGLVTSQGDKSMRTDLVREHLGFDGTNVKVGVLSDSMGCRANPITTLADDIANGDLPADTTILSDIATATCTDEGRAMAQLIYDSAPDSSIAFHTAFNGEADFAQGIIDLALAGADVIVDDVIYFAEPMFQDGIIAQAADEVARLGVPYYSSAGNRAREGFNTPFRPVEDTIDGISGTWHDFDPGPGVDTLQSINLEGFQTQISFQWSEPYFSISGGAGSQSALEVILFDTDGHRIDDCFPGGVFVFPANGICQFTFTDDNNDPINGQVGGDPIDLISFVNFFDPTPVEVQMAVIVEDGRVPEYMQWVNFGDLVTFNEFPTPGVTSYGHNNAAGAESVGAAAFYFTEEFIGDPATLQLRALAGEPECIPACLNAFSSAGGTPIFYDLDGNKLRRPDIRLKPGITAPDGTNNTFFANDTSRDDDDGDGVFQTGEPGEFPNFFGTSAAAPHAAAIAALMVDAENSQILTTTHGGQVKYRMCKPRKHKPKGRHHFFKYRDGDISRKGGVDIRVDGSAVAAQIENGALLGPCSRTEPEDIYWIMRSTAQDMSVRADNGTGATLQVFDEIGYSGFDFDSGFGFVDAKRA
ncbi:MAG: hypothetical protein R3C58_13995, partial [Parvularculaceae bacterium]